MPTRGESLRVAAAAASRRPMTSPRRRALTLDPRSLDARSNDDTDRHPFLSSLSFSFCLFLSPTIYRVAGTKNMYQGPYRKNCTRATCIPRDTFAAEMQNTVRRSSVQFGAFDRRGERSTITLASVNQILPRLRIALCVIRDCCFSPRNSLRVNVRDRWRNIRSTLENKVK